MKINSDKTYYEILQLLYENENGEFFNGSVSIEDKQKIEQYLYNLEKEKKDRFILGFVKHAFLNDSFIENGASIEDLNALINWLEFKFE